MVVEVEARNFMENGEMADVENFEAHLFISSLYNDD